MVQCCSCEALPTETLRSNQALQLWRIFTSPCSFSRPVCVCVCFLIFTLCLVSHLSPLMLKCTPPVLPTSPPSLPPPTSRLISGTILKRAEQDRTYHSQNTLFSVELTGGGAKNTNVRLLRLIAWKVSRCKHSEHRGWGEAHKRNVWMCCRSFLCFDRVAPWVCGWNQKLNDDGSPRLRVTFVFSTALPVSEHIKHGTSTCAPTHMRHISLYVKGRSRWGSLWRRWCVQTNLMLRVILIIIILDSSGAGLHN